MFHKYFESEACTLSQRKYGATDGLYGEGHGTPLQYSCLENPMDRGTWWAAVHGVAKSQTRLRDFTFMFHFHALEKEMATHSGVLAWKIPGTSEPGGLPSMGSHRVGHDWSNLAAAADGFYPWEKCDLVTLKKTKPKNTVAWHLVEMERHSNNPG